MGILAWDGVEARERRCGGVRKKVQGYTVKRRNNEGGEGRVEIVRHGRMRIEGNWTGLSAEIGGEQTEQRGWRRKS